MIHVKLSWFKLITVTHPFKLIASFTHVMQAG